MPHLRFRGFDADIVSAALPELIPQLAAIIDCPEDWLTAELVATRLLTPAAPMIETLWFSRGREIQDEVARALTDAFDALSPTVVFFPLAKSDYYEGGQSCDV